MVRPAISFLIVVAAVGFSPDVPRVWGQGTQQDLESSSRFPILENDEAWKLLPRENPPLPVWARMLVPSLPKTTGAMLQLDYVQRAENPLGVELAAKLQWVVATTLRCPYAQQYAEADLQRAGADIANLSNSLSASNVPLSEAERAAFAFARQMTVAAHEVTDEQFAELMRLWGPDQVVAMVHTLAYANFLNRILLALNVDVEEGGPLPAIDFPLDPKGGDEFPAPERTPPEELSQKFTADLTTSNPDWNTLTTTDLLMALDRQKVRTPRIPLPDPSRLQDLPEEERQRVLKVVWSNVSMSYQPQLTRAWFTCMRTFQDEAKFDRVFSNSVFWVVTRSNDCFY